MIQTKNTQWDLTCFYDGIDDPRIEKDVKKIERAHKSFAKKYRSDSGYLKKPAALKSALEDFEKLFTLPKPLAYLFLSKSINTGDKNIDAKIALIRTRLARAGNETIFFQLSLGALDKKKQKEFLRSEVLASYKYFLSEVFEYGKHNLSEKEAQLVNQLNLPAGGMWVDLTERLQNEKAVEIDGKTVPLAEAMNRVSDIPQAKKRRDLWKNIREEFKKDASVAEAELNALYTKKAILDRERKYKEPFSATLLGFETDPKELDALREAVRENQNIAHDFYKEKKKLLKLKELTYADRNVDIGNIQREFSFNESVNILRGVFEGAHPRFREILESMLASRQIDVFPRIGKTSGAFCFGTINIPTFVMLNHVDTLDSLSTFAHEMGHAIHTELSKKQAPLYQDYSTAVAEFASTFFEELLFRAVAPTLSKREEKILLHNRVNRDVSTVFRQMAFFEFELALHEEVREKGYVSKERIAELLNEKTKQYLGSAVALDPGDGYFFVTLSHIRRHFYVYSYAYGGLLSRLVSKRAQDDPKLSEKVVELLSRGSEVSPHNLFKALGINTKKKETFAEAIDIVKEDLERLKKM